MRGDWGRDVKSTSYPGSSPASQAGAGEELGYEVDVKFERILCGNNNNLRKQDSIFGRIFIFLCCEIALIWTKVVVLYLHAG